MKEPPKTTAPRWTDYLRSRDTGEQCTHDQVTETTNYGLQRTVCGNCGHVSVGYLHDIFEGRELDSQSSAEEVASSS